MAINTEQAGTIFAQMTPEQVRQYLTERWLTSVRYSLSINRWALLTVCVEDMTPNYGNDKVDGLQKDADGFYWGPVTPPFDTQLEGSKFGNTLLSLMDKVTYN